MASKGNKNVFATPWDDSDLVLIVEDKELHVHRWILTMQSPVFKAMLDGHFKESSLDKITLEDDFESMLRFLEALYPPSMLKEVRAPVDDKSRLIMMAVADKYQCTKLIKFCIDIRLRYHQQISCKFCLMPSSTTSRHCLKCWSA